MSTPPKASAAPGPVVFLGPSLAVEEASRILPHALYAPPVRCGDILALSRLRPRPSCIAIIDGCFENVAAVWHKEILWALRRGMRVYGAASMGALRAAELCELGMIGVGGIFEGFRDGLYVDDAEVAVLHRPARYGYTVLTDALVNIRHTLAVARADQVVDDATAQRLLVAAQGVFYQQRVFGDVVGELLSREPALGFFADWLRARGGIVDLKRQDAEALLRHLAQHEPAAQHTTVPEDAARDEAPVDTIFMRTLECYQACRPFPFAASWLSAEEKLGRAARLLGLRYILLRHLALALALLDAGARQRGRTVEDEAWRAMREAPHACQRLGEDLLRFFGLYPLSAQLERLVMPIMAPLSSAFFTLQEYLAESGDDGPSAPEHLLAFARATQDSWGLSGQESLDGWRRQMGLQEGRAHLAFWTAALRLQERLHPYALSYYGCFRVDGERLWLLDALRLSGIYDELVRRLGPSSSPAARVTFVQELAAAWKKLGAAADTHAVECDFESLTEAEAEMFRLEAAPPW